MATITAKGVIGDKKSTITCKEEKNNIVIYIDGAKDHNIKEMLNMLLAIAPPLGGSYYPEEGTMQAYYHVLNTVFFDELTEIEVAGEIEPIPYEESIIY